MGGIVDALQAPNGAVVAAVGAGGKKSLLFSLAAAVEYAIVTSTVHIPEIDENVDALHVTDDPESVVHTATSGTIGVVRGRAPPDRYTGFDPDTIAALAATDADLVLVKADGARMRRFKAPGVDEPVIPNTTDIVAPVASVHVVGEPLHDGLVHRPERVGALTGLDPGDRITPSDVATVITHEQGGLAGVPPGTRVVPVLNMVDDRALAEVARRVADRILEQSARIDRVVLTCLVASNPVVEVRT